MEHETGNIHKKKLNFSADVGVVGNPSLDDLAEIMPVVARSLQDILDYEGDVEEDLLLNFEVTFFSVYNY